MPDTPPGSNLDVSLPLRLAPTRLIFVGGAPRSGTTLVQRLIGGHSTVYSGPEFDFMPRIADLRDDMQRAVRRGRISAIVDASTLDDALSGMVQNIFGAKAALGGHTVFSEKTPSNLLAFETLLKLFPDARFVFVIRDPRDIVASMKEVMRRCRAEGKLAPAFVRSAQASSSEIERYWSVGFRALENNPDRVLPVHYEDIVTDPGNTARSLCSFLGLAFEPGMIRIEEKAFEVTEDVESRIEWYRDDEVTRPIERPEKEKFRNALTPSELGIVAATIADRPMTRRYRFTDEPITVGSRWILTKAAMAHRIREALRGIGRRILA